ncbi:MAG TPA: PHB depolymerase family esterase [Thermoanaerobaculia bacterium]|jgi:predicted peptidase|nr:PHB depolymerase family esterase [Thermoanaerobaculia bacterium]
MTGTPRALDTTITKRLSSRYLLYLPDGYDDAGKTWPLVLFLHGSGERGPELDHLAQQGLPKLTAKRSFPFILVAPQVPAGEVWSTDVLTALLDDLQSRLRIDPDRVYLTGLSMGAFGAWDLAISAPDRFAALVVISGGGNPVEVCRLKDVPVWIVHGRKDDVIPVSWAEELGRRLERCSGRVKVTIYPDAGHDAWSRTYEDPAFYDWLMAQRRPAR